jgi:predicted nucleic acid-binding Zn ribbon protein
MTPLYRYRCCVEWEELRRMDDRAAVCPKCGRVVRPRIGAAALAGDRKTEGKSR